MKQTCAGFLAYLMIILVIGCNSDFMSDDFDDLSEKIKAKNAQNPGASNPPTGNEQEETETPGTGPATGNYVCGSSLPSGFQCLKSATGASTATTFKVPEIVGVWESKDFDFCVSYSSNGTGVITYKANGFSPGSTQNIKWGAMVDSKGQLLKANVGTIYIVHQSTNSTPVDGQIVVLSFKQSTRQWYGFDLKSVSSCAQTVTETPVATGSVIIWTKIPYVGYSITVTMRAQGVIQTTSITDFTKDAAPACGTAGFARYGNLKPGSYGFEASGYRWHASGTPSKASWAGTVEVKSNGCTAFELK